MNTFRQHLISIGILFILLSGLFYLVPLYTKWYHLEYTSAATIGERSEDSENLVAVFLVGNDIQEGKINEYLIVGGKTAKIIAMTYDTVTLETREGGTLVQTASTVGKTSMIRGVSVQLVKVQ